jgi:hypothetical protein
VFGFFLVCFGVVLGVVLDLKSSNLNIL